MKQSGKSSDLGQLISTTSSSLHGVYKARHAALSTVVDQQAGVGVTLETQNTETVTHEMVEDARALATQRTQKGYMDVLTALLRAISQNAASKDELLTIWSASRRQLLVEHRDAVMAGVPCTSTGTGAVLQIENYQFLNTRQSNTQMPVEV